jgi:hypothetical protein
MFPMLLVLGLSIMFNTIRGQLNERLNALVHPALLIFTHFNLLLVIFVANKMMTK